jgi:hypothetical protein
MKFIGLIKAILEVLKELFTYGKKVEKDKRMARVADRRRDKLDWIHNRMSDTAKARRDPVVDSEQ